MKKKLLSLVLAGAMVATTSVSAFAATPGLIDGSDADEHSTNVKITGKVLDKNDNEPAGTFNVTVPTAASFVVSKDNGVISVPINIENNGEQNIDVYAEKFIDTQKGNGINVVPETALETANRTNISLTLAGNLNTLHLKSENDADGVNAGLYKNSQLDAKPSANDLKIANIQSKKSYSLTLSGKAGKLAEDIEKAISNDFTLTLKIKKANKQSS